MPVVAELTVEELALRAGSSTDRVRQLTELGILPSGTGYSEEDVGRVSLVRALVERGFSLHDIAQAVRSGHLSLSWFGGLLPPAPRLRNQTYEELADTLGLSFDLVSRIFALDGLATPPRDAQIRDDDARVLEQLASSFEAFGRDERALMASARYFGDNMRRIAESEIEFFRKEIVEPLLASGRTPREVVETGNQLAQILRPIVNDTLLWLHRRHVDALLIQVLVEMAEASLQEAGVEMRPLAQSPAMAFLDLSGFTRLTDASGDEAALALATSLAEFVKNETAAYRGKVVKLLGDGVMFHFEDAHDAVRCALGLVAKAPGLGLPPARVGVEVGPVVFRDGDYFGQTVNVAARITDHAAAGEVLVSEAVVHAIANANDIVFSELGPVALKGVAGRIPLFEARSTTARGH